MEVSNNGRSAAAVARPYAEFPEQEFLDRYDRLREQMYRNNMVAILATTEPNFRYMTGLHNQRWRNTLRPHAVLLPLKGDPVVLQPTTDNWGLHQITWIKELRGFGGPRIQDGYGAHFVELVRQVLAERGIKRGRIGTERGWQVPSGISIDDFKTLERELHPLELVDASPVFWDVRMFKSELEIECIRQAARITSAAYRDIRKQVRMGMTEIEVEQRMCAALLLNGAERPTYVPVSCHAGRWPMSEHLLFGLSTSNQLRADHVLDIDAGCTFKGYWSDFSRMYGIGRPPDKARAAYAVAQEAIDAGFRAIEPGRPISAVYRAMASVFKGASSIGISETGLSETGLNGHGTGLSATERPYVNLRDNTIMAKGLYFTVEPIFEVQGWGLVFGEEMVVVTDDGYELLSDRAEPELPLIG